MARQNVDIIHTKEDRSLINVRLQFEHCSDCCYFKRCYGDGEHGPYYIEEACVDAPHIKIELKKEGC